MNIVYILKLKYPTADFRIDIILQDDGQGPYIKEWNLSDPKPTKKTLEQWAIDLEPQYQLAQNKLANKPLYDQLDALDLKSIRPIREKNTTKLADLERQAADLRSALLPIV